MATTIQTIQKPTRARALDTSGNNNHGQIYSGRALEFDGITDYLTNSNIPSMDEKSAITITCWAKVTATGSGDDYMIELPEDSAGTNGCGIRNRVDEFVFDIRTHDDGTITDRSITYTYELNTWYRLALTYDGTTGKAYVNGVLADSDTVTLGDGIKHASGDICIGGFSSAATGYLFGGLMADVQIWDAAWTADDALFDYNNPEQLALNRGGTSLTNSNLKIWYPMNDGHRGQQSYVLDASNTGLGDSILSNGDFSTGDTTGWTFGDSTGTIGTYFGESNVCKIEVTSEDTVYMSQNNITTVGQNYKYSFDYYIPSTNTNLDAIQLRSSSSSSNKIIDSQTATDTWTSAYAYYTPGSSSQDNIYVYLNSTSTGGNDLTVGNSVYVKNIKIEPVNGKNHATTVFHGDELVVGTDSTFAGSGNWTAAGSATITPNYDSTDVGYDSTLRMQAGTTGYGRAALDQSDLDSVLIAGRTYLVTFKYKFINNTDMTHDAYVNVGNHIKQNIVRTNTSWTSYSDTFTAKDSSTSVKVYCQGDSGHADNEMLLDTFSIKEQGTATGWTDADQQLDIPQTALQSYNQLAWFPGVDPGIDYDIDLGSGSELDDIWAGGGTASAWIYPIGLGATAGRIFDKTRWLFYMASGGTKLGYTFGHDTTNASGTTSNAVLTVGKWAHVAMTYNSNNLGAGNEPKIYVNGEEVAVTEADSAGAYASDASSNLFIGNSNAGTRTFDGCITEVSIWSASLNASEISQLYNDGKALDATLHTKYSEGAANLKGYWRNNGLSSWTDLTGNGNNGTVNNITETMLITAGADASRDSQGFLMNRQRATNSLNTNEESYTTVDINHTFGTADFSYGFWFKLEDTENGYLVGVQSMGNSTGVGLIIDLGNGKIRARPFGVTAVYTSAGYDDGEWHYAHHNIDRSANAILYIDGATAVLTQDISGVTGNSLSTNKWHIGAEVGTSGFLAGEIDDLIVYTDILTTAEITRNYNAGKRSHR